MRSVLRPAPLVALALAASAAPVRARASAEIPQGAVVFDVVGQRGDTLLFRPKSPERALGLSFGTTAAGAGLVGLAAHGASGLLGALGGVLLLVGPSTGHFHVRNDRQGLGGLVLRGASAAAARAVFLLVVRDEHSGDDQGSFGPAVLLSTAGVFVASTAYDVATAPAAARRYNRRHRVALEVGPVVGPRAVGARLAVRF